MSYTLTLFVISLLASSCVVLPFAFGQNTTMILSPRKQIANGVLSEDIVCSDGFVSIQRSPANSPVCVTPETAKKLVDRGWGKDWMVGVNVVRYTDNPKFGSIDSFPHQPIMIINQANLTKYPFLQSWLKNEDKLVADYIKFCKEHNCLALWQYLPSTVYYPTIGEITVREMIKDPALGSHISYELPTSNIYEVYIQVDGVDYGMDFFCRTHSCS